MNKNNKKGFTLAELLIVVAIIGVLVAVSIPIFTAQLEKSREATDVANMRAAKAEGVATLLTDEYKNADGTAKAPWEKADDGTFSAYYDAAAGVMVAAKPDPVYGKGTKQDGGNAELGYESTKNYTSSVIKVTLDPDNDDETKQIDISWDPAPTE